MMGRHLWRIGRAVLLAACCGCVLSGGLAAVDAAGMASLQVTVGGLRPGGVILGVYAFCVPAQQGHVARGPNRSPAISWSKGPAGTLSYASILFDTDVPQTFETANKEGQTIAADVKRRDAFYHWVLVDIPATITALPAGAESSGPDAKAAGPTKYGVRGVNDFGGGRAGYDGPCPPWNDAVVHHYHFVVYALNVRSLGLSGTFGGPQAMTLMGHVLARGEVVGLYTLNPDVAKTLGK